MNRLLCFLLLTGVLAAGCASRRPRSVQNPVVESTNSVLKVRSVDLTDSTTVLNVRAVYRPKRWIKISSGSTIQADGKSYQLIGSEVLTPDSLFWMPESGEADFSLVFPSLPAKTKSIDFVEGPGKDGWNIRDIDLTGKRKSPKWLDEIPTEFRKEKPVGDALPPVPMDVDSTRIDFRIAGWQKDMPLTLSCYFWQLGAEDQFEKEVELDSLGRGSLVIWTPGLTRMLFYRGYQAVTYFLVPGEDVTFWLAPIGNTEVYSNSSLASVSEQISSMPDGIFGNEHPHISYLSTHDEYVDEIFRKYSATKKNIEANAQNPIQRQFAMLILQNGMLELAVNAESHLNKDIESKFGRKALFNGEYADSLKFHSLTPEALRRVSDLFDTASPDLMWVNNGDYAVDPKNAGIIYKKSPLPERMKAIRQLDQKMLSSESLPYPIDTIRSWGPFYAKIAETVLANAKSFNTDMIKDVADVPAEKVFDAIIAPYKGKVVMVDLWDTWCGPCRKALKENEPLKTGEFADSDVVWIYIADESSPYTKYLSMVQDIQGVHYRLSQEQIEAIRKRFKVDGIPYYILVDRDGNATGRPDLRDHSLYVSELKKALTDR